MLTGTLYGKTITAKTFPALKRMASKVANNYFHVLDEMEVSDGKNTCTLYRVNRKCPDNTIYRGSWR